MEPRGRGTTGSIRRNPSGEGAGGSSPRPGWMEEAEDRRGSAHRELPDLRAAQLAVELRFSAARALQPHPPLETNAPASPPWRMSCSSPSRRRRGPGGATAPARVAHRAGRKLVEELVELDVPPGIDLVGRPAGPGDPGRRPPSRAASSRNTGVAQSAQTPAASTTQPPQWRAAAAGRGRGADRHERGRRPAAGARESAREVLGRREPIERILGQGARDGVVDGPSATRGRGSAPAAARRRRAGA